MTTETILIVDDDPAIVKTVRSYLEQMGYTVRVAYNGATALQILHHEPPDCVILDVMLPDHDGWEITRRVRADARSADIPIIMLTARVDDTDKIIGLEMGADDYVTKPFNPRELLARIRARLRRSHRTEPANLLRVGNIKMDIDRRSVHVNADEIDLTPTEFDVLRTFLQAPGYVFTRDELIEKALGYTYAGLGRTLDSHIKNLRRKIEPDAREPRYIQTVYGVGYRLLEAEA